MPDNRKVVEASMRLRMQVPEAWEALNLALREYAANATADMLRAPPEFLVKAQGMAVMANEIAAVIRDAPALFENHKQARTK